MDLLSVGRNPESFLIEYTLFLLLLLSLPLFLGDQVLLREALEALVLAQVGVSSFNCLIRGDPISQFLNEGVLLPLIWLGLILLLSWISNDSVNRDSSTQHLMAVLKHGLLILHCSSLA